MKVTTLIIFIVIVGAVFISFNYMADDLNTNYANISGAQQINTSHWSGKYNYTEKVNASIAPLIEDFQKIEDENAGWFSKLASGIVAIPHAVIGFASLAIGSISTMGSLITNMATFVHIPPIIIYSIIIIITLWVLSKLLGFFQKADA